MKLKDILKGFRPITPQDEVHVESRWSPRFWRSICFLASDSANLIGKFNDEIVVVRCKVIHGNVAAYLPFPPQKPDTLKAFIDSGISCKLSPSELLFFEVDAVPDHKNIEHIYYGIGDQKLPGKVWANVRYGKNLLERRVKNGDLIVVEPTKDEMIDLARRWYAQRKSIKNTERLIDKFIKTNRPKTATGISDGKTLVGLSLVEHFSAECGAIIVRIRDCEHPLSSGVINGLHHLDLQTSSEITIGSAVGIPGLSFHKEKLSPGYSIQIHSAVVSNKPTLDDYREWKSAISKNN